MELLYRKRLLSYLLIQIQASHQIGKIVPSVKFHTWKRLLSVALEKSVFAFNISKYRKVTEEGYTRISHKIIPI